ncbi:MAG: hypothetical protein JSW27_05160 [Phycisphaerales bacterium]|nr:MAG: hypothetical protein JSW27_05160 [Phycisphaerales bacterium]
MRRLLDLLADVDQRSERQRIGVSWRDLARYPLLYLNQGNWSVTQILDPAFVQMATSTQVPARMETAYFDLTGRYGFFWWINGIKADGRRPWPGAPPRTFNAHGAGLNFIFVIPEWQLIIVRLSLAPGGHVHLGQTDASVWGQFFSKLGTAVED